MTLANTTPFRLAFVFSILVALAVCLPTPAAAQTSCTTSAQCGSGRACVYQTCRTACTSSSQCSGNQACVQGGCVAQGTGSGPTGGGTNPAPPGSNPAGAESGTLVNPLKADNLEELLAIVVQAVVRLGAILLILVLIWTGFMFVMARGNAEEITKARRAFLWAVIGGLVLLGAEALSRVIQSTANAL